MKSQNELKDPKTHVAFETSKPRNPDTKDASKYKVYSLLYDILQKREAATKEFKKNHNVTPESGLIVPKYEVPWVTFWMQKAEQLMHAPQANHEAFKIYPQFSYFQIPLLEFAPKVIDAFLNPYP